MPIGTDPDWPPVGWAYEVHIKVSAREHKFSILLDAGEPIDLTDFLPAGPVPAAPEVYVPTSWINRPGGVAGLGEDGLIPWELLPAGSGGEGGSVTWSSITGKPSTFPPDAHSHAISDVTNLQTVLDGKAAVAHTHDAPTWDSVTGKPATFPPTAHGHTIGDVEGLQDALDGLEGGTGNVSGPASSADGRVALFDGTTGKLLKQALVGISAAGDVEGIRRVLRTFAAAIGKDTWLDRIDLNYSPAVDDMDLFRLYVQGQLVFWYNENHFIRGTPHEDYKDDALLRGRARSDLTNQDGGYIELENSASQKLHARRWRDGALIRGNGNGTVVCSDVLVLGATDPIPVGTPANILIYRRPS